MINGFCVRFHFWLIQLFIDLFQSFLILLLEVQFRIDSLGMSLVFWWHTLIIRRFIFNISSVRFISIKFPWTSRHIITKSSLLLRMSITFQCDFRRVVTLRVFQTEVYLRLERSLCRCNLRTEVTSFTRMKILDFVCEIMFSQETISW